MFKALDRIIKLIVSLPKGKFFFLIFLLTILTATIWWPFYNGFQIEGDATAYNELGINLANDKGFYRDSDGGRTMVREPGYPFFLAVNYKLFGVNPNIIRFEQFLLLFFICFLCYLVAREVAGERVGRFSAILLAIFPTLNIFGSYIFSEVLAVFLLLFFTFVLILAEKKNKIYMFGLAGFIFGGLVLTKAIFLYLASFLIIIFLIKLERQKFLKLLLFIFASSVIVAPWLYRNNVYFDKLMLSDRGGTILRNHAIKVTYGKEEIKDYLGMVILGEYFVRLKKPSFASKDINGKISTDSEFFRLAAEGKSDREIDTIITKQSKKLLFAHPFKFFCLGVLEMVLLNTPMVPFHPLTQTFSGTNLNEFKFLKLAILILIRIFWFFGFLVLVVFGFLKVFKKNKFEGLLIASYVFYINGVSLGIEGVARLLLPFYPYYFMLFVYGLVNLRKKELNLFSKHSLKF